MHGELAVSLVIPCLDEAEGLRAILEKVPSFVDEVVVADNGSTDGSVEVARRRGARVIDVAERGYGAACRAGLLSARGDALVLLDGDDSYPVEAAGELVERLRSRRADLVSGCRFPLKRRDSMRALNRWSNRAVTWAIRAAFRIDIRDSQSGMLALRRSALDRFLPASNGMSFSQELKLRAWLDPRTRCEEMPIDYRKRVGRVKFRALKDGFANARDLAAFFIRRPVSR